ARSRLSGLAFGFSAAAAPPEILPLSLHDALPILAARGRAAPAARRRASRDRVRPGDGDRRRRQVLPGRHELRGLDDPAPSRRRRSEEHTSELQSRENLVCRLLLEKKKTEKEKQNR